MPSIVPRVSPPHLTPLDVFALAGPLQKVVVVLLLVSVVVAVFILVMKLSPARRLSGGSAFISGLRLGGPIIGGLGACASMLMMTLGYASFPGDLPLKALAPGFAEAFLQLGVGFLAGAIAVCCNWAVESRIDRQVLSI